MNDMKVVTLKQNYYKNIEKGNFENLYANEFQNLV